jgi:hypothetical protein
MTTQRKDKVELGTTIPAELLLLVATQVQHVSLHPVLFRITWWPGCGHRRKHIPLTLVRSRDKGEPVSFEGVFELEWIAVCNLGTATPNRLVAKGLLASSRTY